MCCNSNEWPKRFELSYEWTICDLNRSTDSFGQYIKSDEFGHKDDNLNNWSLYLYPRGVDEKTRDFVGLFLEFRSILKRKISVEYQISIMSGDKWRQIDGIINHCFTSYESFGTKKFISKSRLLKETRNPSNNLIIKCHIIYEFNRPFQMVKRFGLSFCQLVYTVEDLLELWDCFFLNNGKQPVNDDMIRLLSDLIEKKSHEFRDRLVGIDKSNNKEMEEFCQQFVSLINEKSRRNAFK